MASGIRKGDMVVVIAGRDRASRGRVLLVDRVASKAIVEGVNIVKRHQAATAQSPQGGIIEKEAPIHLSNLMMLDPKTDGPTRLRVGTDDDGKKVRLAVKSGSVIEG